MLVKAGPVEGASVYRLILRDSRTGKNMTEKPYEITQLGRLILKDESRLKKLVMARESEYPDLREFELTLKWEREDRLKESDKEAGI